MKGVEGDPLRDPREAHLRNIRQLTTGGTNAEAYFSYDGRHLIFQATRDGFACDQIFVMDLEGSKPKLVSTGMGRAVENYRKIRLFKKRGIDLSFDPKIPDGFPPLVSCRAKRSFRRS